MNVRVQSIALFLAFLAGMSEMLGQSVVLVLNRVPLFRFIISLMLTGIVYVSTALIWAAGATFFAHFFHETSLPFDAFLGVIALGFAPRLFGFLVIAPYYGVLLSRILDAWALACVTYGVRDVADIPLVYAALCSGIGWGFSVMVRGLTSQLTAPAIRFIRRCVAGTPLELTPQQLHSVLLGLSDRQGSKLSHD